MDKIRDISDRNKMCFACGKDNPIGLHMHFQVDANSCAATFIPRPEHQSYDGRMHGGLITTLLDETMGNYCYLYEHRNAYTARMDIRFKEPILIGEKLKIVAHVEKRKGRLIEMSGKIIKEDGTIGAEALAKMMYEANDDITTA